MEVSFQFHVPAALFPEKEPPVPIGQEAELAPEPVWTRWRSEKFPASVGMESRNNADVLGRYVLLKYRNIRRFSFSTDNLQNGESKSPPPPPHIFEQIRRRLSGILASCARDQLSEPYSSGVRNDLRGYIQKFPD
jgi:hypothetical protein